MEKAIQRHLDRFPNDFMFRLKESEWAEISIPREGRGGRSYLPYVFTENGVAMLSSVLTSSIAIQVNIEIMRFFTRTKSLQKFPPQNRKVKDELKAHVNKLFEIVFERLDSIEETIEPKLPTKRKKIGLK